MSLLQNKSTEESELEEIRKGFQMFDTNGTGLVNPLEIKEAMESMNMQEKNPFLYDLISSLSSSEDFQNKDGISIDDLVSYVYEKVNDNESNTGLRQLFDALKDPGSNTISMSTFMKLARDYDEEDVPGDELRYLLEKTQLGGDELTFEEFCTIMKGGLSSASVRSEEPDLDKDKITKIEIDNINNEINNNISQEIKEVVNESYNKDDTSNLNTINNLNNININESHNDNVNLIEENTKNKENEIDDNKNDEIDNSNNNKNNNNNLIEEKNEKKETIIQEIVDDNINDVENQNEEDNENSSDEDSFEVSNIKVPKQAINNTKEYAKF